jgi:hypothetical protein
MEIKLTILEYSDQGLQLEWEEGFEIKTAIINGDIVISANKAGLISLARHMLTLAQDVVPVGHHLHFDEFNCLEEDSAELIIERR